MNALRILFVDVDRFRLRHLIDYLELEGMSVEQATSVEYALKLVRTQQYDCIVVDVMMPRGSLYSEIETAGGYQTGILLSKDIRRFCPDIPIMALTQSEDRHVKQWFNAGENMCYCHKSVMPDHVAKKIKSLCRVSGTSSSVFIVHGHDRELTLELKNFLQDSLSLPEPMVLAELPSRGLTIIEKFERYARKADVVFVLMSPDDMAGPVRSKGRTVPRPRQNVVFEHGYFLGLLGRKSGKVIILKRGSVELPSDIGGVVYIDVTGGLESKSEEIRRELQDLLD